MNCCLLLLILLFSSGNNTKDCHKSHHRCHLHERGCNERPNYRPTPSCESPSCCQTPPPPMPRGQFPFLDDDNKGCGCEG